MKKLLARSIFAGISIGLGGIIFLNCDNKIIGSFLFSIGLLAVLLFQLDLYTGRVCYINNSPKEWPIVLIGNTIGAVIMGLFAISKGLDSSELIANKADKPIITLLIDGIICGICIAIAVRGYKQIHNPIIPIIGVMVFILCGSEHCIADIFYFTVSPNVKFILPLLVIILGNTIGGCLFSLMDYIKKDEGV